jgi:trk system potassium uptake protein TrkH
VVTKRRDRISKWDVASRRRLVIGLWITPPRLLGGSFAALIAVGTLGLMYLPGLYTGEPLNWLDALFTATSAVCVTGLIVVDTATYFTLAGQAWILLMIQLGGLGMIALSSIIIVALGKRLSLKHEALNTDIYRAAPHVNARSLTFDVLRFTLILEAIGAFALYLLWIPRFGWVEAAWHAVFHSVSAFCNAGFSTFSDSLIGFQEAPVSLSVIMLLVVAGGLGFLTLEEFYMRYQAGKHKRVFRTSLHSRLVVATTAGLILIGWILFFVFEEGRTLKHLSLPHKATNSLFMSVTPRTAGFNTIDYNHASDSSNFLTILLMTVGGSPGSTAGGIKTTTFALIGILAWSRLMGHEMTNFASRSIRKETTERAVGLTVMAFTLVAAGIFLLTAFQPASGRFLGQMFEVTSAFNTVGLSMGETPALNSAGRVLMIILMFFGRVGPLTIAAAIAVRQYHGNIFRYAYEDVVVG